MSFDLIPVLLEPPHGIPHGVRVLAHDQGQGVRGGATLRGVPLQLARRRVHRAEDVRVEVDGLDQLNLPLLLKSCVFVLHGSGGITMFQPHIRLMVIHSVPCLVAQRPHDDARMVLVAFAHPGDPRHVCGAPRPVVPQRRRAIPHTVTLDIGLVNHVQAMLITQIVPQRIVGIVGATNSIEVKLFHESDVLQHRLSIDDVSVVAVMLVTIDTLEGDLLAIDEEPSLSNLHRSETHAKLQALHLGRILVAEGTDERVESRHLGTPRLHMVHSNRTSCNRNFVAAGDEWQAQGAQAVAQLTTDSVPEVQGALQRCTDAQNTSSGDLSVNLQSPVGRGPDCDVTQVLLGSGVCVDSPLDASKPPHVLIFEICTRAPAQNLKCEDVPTTDEVLVQLELHWQLAVGTESQLLAVEPYSA
mmetsp:Transcript_50598/g.134686  ORF Transcript_50598/g.134686 Transcript_50598/m.134686 type:complete len:414 (+) Transcript_50598:462-1703(+)